MMRESTCRACQYQIETGKESQLTWQAAVVAKPGMYRGKSACRKMVDAMIPPCDARSVSIPAGMNSRTKGTHDSSETNDESGVNGSLGVGSDVVGLVRDDEGDVGLSTANTEEGSLQNYDESVCDREYAASD